ncbi:hypothetical protein R1flu_005288 [Riccia fluitans]|uniref:Replitron HUH endonuclease domain-containing protein n=1 Tax=Riccia fluitans TaxID=41844 RepID=A0ABD1YTP9_9MARC
MQRIRYSAPRPWPDAFSLVEAVEVKNIEFSPTKVTQHVGRVGIIPRTWNKEKQDWYLDILEFVCIRTVQRQKEKVVGPFSEKQCFCGYGLPTEKHEGARPGSDEKELPGAPGDGKNETTTDIEQGSEGSKAHGKKKNGQEAAKANQTKAAKKPRRVPEKTFDVSLTIGIPGETVDENVFDLLVNWLEYRAEMAVLALERGDAFLQLHVQGMVRVKTSSTKILNREIKVVIGWESNAPVGGSVCLKPLHDRGLHTVIGLIGYCLKDEGAAHFKFYSKNVSEEQKAEYIRSFGIQAQVRADTGQYPRQSITVSKVSSEESPLNNVQRACTTPHSVEVPDVETIFFGVETPARYFETKEDKTTAEDDDVNVDEESELAGQSRPVDDEDASTIPLVELDKAVNSEADVHTLCEALLEAGFAVGMKTTVKEENPMDHIPEYFRLWD